MTVSVDWRGVLLFGLSLAGAITLYVLGNPEAGGLLLGAAVGIFGPAPAKVTRNDQ